MDMIDVKSYSLVVTFLAFIGVGWWAFSPSRKKRFDEDAKLPFAEDDYVNSEGKNKKASDDAEDKRHN